MGEKDIAEKTLEAYNDVFADIVNVLLFNGKRLVNENDLTDMTLTSQYKTDKKLHAQERDIAKYWQNAHVRIAIYGLENQTEINYDMPLRILSYDGAAYRAQLNEKNKDDNEKNIRYPVVTMVLYFGEEPWNKPRSLLERIQVPEALKPYVSDYKINVFEICRLTPEQVHMFQSDFKFVADYFTQMFRNKEYQPGAETIKHVHEVLTLLSVITGDSSWENTYNRLTEQERKEANTMQGIMHQTYNKGISVGEARGRAEGKAEGKAEGIIIGEARGRSNVLETLVAQGLITQEQAEQFVQAN